MRMIRLVLISVLLSGGAGCGWIGSYFIGDDNSLPAAKLQPIDEPIAIQQLWQRRATSGDGDLFIRLVPALGNNRIYVAGHKGEVAALDAQTGRIIWSVDSDVMISAGVGAGAELVLVGSSDGEVLALSQASGEEIWRARVSSEVLAPPGAAEGIVVVRSIDGQVTGFDAASGAKLWDYSFTVPALSLRGTSAAVLAGGAVMLGLDNGRLILLGLRDGIPLGGKVIAPVRGRTEIDRLVDIDADLKLDGEIVYAAAYQRVVSAIDLRSGNTLWQQPVSSYAGLSIAQGELYVSDTDGAVWALDRRNGGTLWKQEELSGRRLSAPAVLGPYLAVGDFEGYLHWLERSNGRIVGRVKVDSERIAAAPLALNGTLYVLGKSGNLSSLRPGG